MVAISSHHPGTSNVTRIGSSNGMNSVKFHFHGRAAELMNVEASNHYMVEDGGYEPNVIPPYARLWYYFRAPERDEVESIYQWLLDLAKGADLMAQSTHKIEFLSGCYNTLPNLCLCELVTENMRAMVPPPYTANELAWAAELDKSVTALRGRQYKSPLPPELKPPLHQLEAKA